MESTTIKAKTILSIQKTQLMI